MRRECDGGAVGGCGHRAVWSVKLAGDPDDTASYACGQHLHFAASEITGGEQGDLDLRRLVCDER